MSFCLTELHLWSLKNTLRIEDRDIGIYQYYEKKDSVSPTDHGYLEEKQQLAESRDYPWILKNRRPEKLRDTLKELEELMQNSRCVLSKWKNKYVCQLLFGSGVLVSLSLSGPQLDKVVIDRTLVGKLISDTISDAILTDSFIILSFLEQNKLCYIQFTKKLDSPDINKRFEKLSTSEYKISYLEIPGPVSRRTVHHLAINCVQDMAICWWEIASDDVWPWSPISSEKDRANLFLLACNHGRLEVLSFIRTEWNPLDASFSTNQPYQVHTVEHSISVGKEPMADSCIYECVRNKIHCVTVTRIPLRSKAISCCRNVAEDKLILGCEDSSIILYEAHRRVTLLAQAEILPTFISCHPGGAIFLVGSSQGDLQIFDIALSPIKVQLLAEDCSPRKTLQLSKHFDVSSSLIQMQWTAPQFVPQTPNSIDVHDLLFLRFNRGPLGVLLFKLGIFTKGQLSLVELIHQYIRYDEIHEAISVLSSMNWNTMGHQCYMSMSAIVNHLLRQRLTPEREAQLEASLGSFYAPTRPLSDTTILEYRDPISKYARRFFHHLLRYQRFEKAFLLAVDIGARDLFMDIHYFAIDKGELALAEVAKKRANDIDAESITTGVELLGPLDGGDTLNEAFVGLSLTPQGEETFPDILPPSGSSYRHISQQTALTHSSNRPVLDRESKFEKDSYAAPLMENTIAWNSEGELREDDTEQEIGDGGSLRMVHFGLV
ncbi:WD repeat-containing and planar cell polarity effector protein fritz homolog [Trichosurus vulpecula]|uniref:WD repeat-containing and planar cell polarity effector protein fritz homolog n=1 Tax=Trichosurus vulpecula TaxID=9337 RepID=UPI00186B406F|nr:WD repeat-containing and planar cell polarity effector protein fritz homolog [Trichosurus vulpecula]